MALTLVQFRKFFGQEFQFLVRHVFEIDQLLASAPNGTDHFIKLKVHRLGITVLGALNEEDHDKGYDGRARVDYQLPRIRKMKEGPGRRPDQNHEDRGQAGPYGAN